MKTIFLIAVLLTGCATEQSPVPSPQKSAAASTSKTTYRYIQPMKELTPEQIARRDKTHMAIAACKWEVAKAMGSRQSGYSMYTAAFNSISDTFKEAELTATCLEVKGYKGES